MSTQLVSTTLELEAGDQFTMHVVDNRASILITAPNSTAVHEIVVPTALMARAVGTILDRIADFYDREAAGNPDRDATPRAAAAARTAEAVKGGVA